MKKNKNVFQIEVVPSAKQQTLQAFFQYFKLSGLFFDRRRDEYITLRICQKRY